MLGIKPESSTKISALNLWATSQAPYFPLSLLVKQAEHFKGFFMLSLIPTVPPSSDSWNHERCHLHFRFIEFLLFLFLIMCVCVPVWGYVHVSTGTFRVQKKMLDFLELELQTSGSYGTWVLGPELFATTASAFNIWAICLTPHHPHFKRAVLIYQTHFV